MAGQNFANEGNCLAEHSLLPTRVSAQERPIGEQYDDAFALVKRARDAEKAGNTCEAKIFYEEAVEDFCGLCIREAGDNRKVEMLQGQIEQLCARARALAVPHENNGTVDTGAQVGLSLSDGDSIDATSSNSQPSSGLSSSATGSVGAWGEGRPLQDRKKMGRSTGPGTGNNGNTDSTGPVSNCGEQDDHTITKAKALDISAKFLLERAITTDEKGNSALALPLYLKAADEYVTALSLVKIQSLVPGASSNITVTEFRMKFQKRLASILERAEALKKELAFPHQPKRQFVADSVDHTCNSGSGRAPGPQEQSSSLGGGPAPSRNVHKSVKGEKLSHEEINVLRISSRINGKVYLPWENTDIHDTFVYSKPWKDPDGRLELSNKQKKYFGGWSRPSRFVRSVADPVMIARVSAASITQDNVGDCSFVSSLCMAAAYERKFRRKLLTNIIYPQDRTGSPIYNPSGKYIVRLFVGGIARKVIVDDEMPVDKQGRLLCARTTRANELWVSIIEKAYMKLNGGYNFPGSTACIDMHALTGWIPESVKLIGTGERAPRAATSKNHVEVASVEGHGDADRIWQRLLSASNFGDCLVSISTTTLTQAEEERCGLVSGHAYAVLRVVEVEGWRMLQVKNPWGRVRWKGRFSPADTVNWTPKLKRALNYDAATATQFDNGVFWIDYGAVRQFFATLHMVWNPGLFSFRHVVHGSWRLAAPGPKSDRYCIFDNPQYHLEIKAAGNTETGAGGGGGAKTRETTTVWVLLTRHQLKKETDHDEHVPLMAIHSFYSKGKNRKLYSKADRSFAEGVYSNTPHRLMRMDLRHGRDYEFTLVVSQIKKVADVNFSLTVYCSNAPVYLHKIQTVLLSEVTVTGEWVRCMYTTALYCLLVAVVSVDYAGFVLCALGVGRECGGMWELWTIFAEPPVLFRGQKHPARSPLFRSAKGAVHWPVPVGSIVV